MTTFVVHLNSGRRCCGVLPHFVTPAMVSCEVPLWFIHGWSRWSVWAPGKKSIEYTYLKSAEENLSIHSHAKHTADRKISHVRTLYTLFEGLCCLTEKKLMTNPHVILTVICPHCTLLAVQLRFQRLKRGNFTKLVNSRKVMFCRLTGIMFIWQTLLRYAFYHTIRS